MLFDTDVLVWALRGNRKAGRVIDAADDRQISIINYMELLQGARNKSELKTIQNFLIEYFAPVLPLNESIGHRALVYLEEYGLQSGLCVADALIAATAVENRLTLCTANQKHYKVIADLALRIFRP